MQGQIALFNANQYRAAPGPVRDICDETVEVSVKPVREMTAEEQAACIELTLPTGMMRGALEQSLSLAASQPRSLRARLDSVVMLRRDEQLVAWALVFHPRFPQGRRTVVHMFVAEEHRRGGLGRVLLRHLRGRWPEGEYCPWDERSYEFFTGCGVQRFAPMGEDYVRRQDTRRLTAVAA